MAFSAAGGYSSLPNGNWAPAIYSQKVLTVFRTASDVDDILVLRLKSSKSQLLLSRPMLVVQF